MAWRGPYIAVDWGTTNRRAYRVEDRGCVAEFEDDRGVLSLAAGEFPEAVAEIRARLGDHPLLMAGMVGSNRGWIEAPYAPCPADVDDLVAQLTWAEPGRAAIVPGLSISSGGRADVMRGEEVQLFGAIAAGMVPPSSIVCHPGTHNKWVRVEGGRIVDFQTVMTGELFNLLRDKSILADLMQQPVMADAAFAAGAREGLSGTALTAGLFSVRARVLLGEARRDEASSFTSGLLIGADVRTGLSGTSDEEIYIMGRPELTQLYAVALQQAGRGAREIDGEAAFLHGIAQIADRIV